MNSLGDELVYKETKPKYIPHPINSNDSLGSKIPSSVSGITNGVGLTEDHVENTDPFGSDPTNPGFHEISDEMVLDSNTLSNSQSPIVAGEQVYDTNKPDGKRPSSNSKYQQMTSESAVGSALEAEDKDRAKISAYARLDFDSYTFFVQTLQVILGRKSNDEILNGAQHSVDVHLSSKKAISRRHAKIFYNFGTQRFELSIMGRNGAFVDDLFIEKGMTIPLVDGTKIQIGDIPFSFILPSLESNQLKDASASNKPFNPSDAISLRSSLYSTSSSTSPNKHANLKKSSINRRSSRRLLRRLSEARRKSLASATNDEINSILSELGVTSVDDIDEQDPAYVDAQIKAILGDNRNVNESAIADDEEDDEAGISSLAQFNEGEEDELDKLVKQHNLEQGVDLDEKALERDEHQIAMDIHALDEEIGKLEPMIRENDPALGHQKEERKRQLEEAKKSKNDLQQARTNLQQNNSYPYKYNHNVNNGIQRAGPLMGKPATPRMGKPASIQPPASRLYGRSISGSINGNNVTDSDHLSGMNRLATTSSSSITGLPTHLVAQGPGDYSLKVAQGSLGQPNLVRGYSPRPPVPELLVPIETIKQRPLKTSKITIEKITVLTETKPPPVYLNKVLGKTPMVPKIPIRKRDSHISKRPSKSGFLMSEIPEQYRTKPSLTVPVMLINVLKNKSNTEGMTLNEIYDGIREIYPYYKYCPDGWQSGVVHNIKLNKLFKVKDIDEEVSKEYPEDKWIIDESFVQEKEKARRKQQEIGAQRAKEAAIKAEELKQKQRLELQQSISHNIAGREYVSPYGSPMNSQLLTQYQQKQGSPGYSSNNSSAFGQYGNATDNNGSQKPKTIAELASEIRRDSAGSKTPMYFRSQSNPVGNNSGDANISPSNIKAQLAANRSQYSQSPPKSYSTVNTPTNPSPTSQKLDPAANNQGTTNSSPRPQSPSMNQDTKKSLSYLQKELFNLYKARKLSYNTTTTTEIITKALATTIAQVNVIGSKAGVKDNALSFLVERAPQQVSKILDIALTKSIKEKQGILTSRSNSRGTTPGASQIPSPKRIDGETKESTPISSIVREANKRFGNKLESSTTSPAVASDTSSADSFGKPPLFADKGSKSSPSLSRPMQGTPVSSIPKPQSYNKPPGLSKPPQFLSNKKQDNKRTRQQDQGQGSEGSDIPEPASKVQKT